jgi:pimeloyl-ACP methyl ester carboxylesterase
MRYFGSWPTLWRDPVLLHFGLTNGVLGSRAEILPAPVLMTLLPKIGIPKDRVGLLGHSEGGMVALTAATAGIPDVPFCVLLASPLLSGIDNLVRSFALLARGGVVRDDAFEMYASDLDTLVRIARTDPDPSRHSHAQELAARLAPLIMNKRSQPILGADTLAGPEFLGLLSSPCLETCLSWDPERIAPRLTCPVLIVYGGLDVQAPARENLDAAHALCDRLGKSNWTIREALGMNHAFQRCTTGMPDEYEAIDHVMADDVVDEVAVWIKSIRSG